MRSIASTRPTGGVALLLLALTALPIPAGAQPALTPDAAYRMALAQAPQLVQSRAQVAEARGAVREAQGHLLPKLNLAVTGSGSDNPLNVFGMKLQQQNATFDDFGAGQFLQGIQQNNPAVVSQAPANLNQPDWYRNYQTKLELGIPIYNGGQVWGGLHRARAMLRAAQQGQELARQKVLFEVIRLFQGIHTAEGYRTAAQQGIAAANSYVDITGKLYQQGVVDRTDVLRAQVHLGDARLALAESEKSLAVAQEGMRVLTGVPDDVPLVLAPGTVDLATAAAGPDQLQQEAVSGNPGLGALASQLQAARAGVTQARAAYLPHFNVVVDHQWNNDTLALEHPADTVAGVLSWDLFDLGSRGGAADRAEAAVIKQQGALREAQDQLRVKVRQAWQEVQLARTRIEVKQSAVADASEAARLATLRYQKGVATFTQLLAAQAELDKARADLVSARYQDVMARAGLLLALGRLEPSAVTLTAPNNPS